MACRIGRSHAVPGASDSRLRRFAVAAVVAAWMAFAPGDAAAFDPYVVDPLVVSVLADDAAAAKEEAFAQALDQGLERVLRRVASSADRARLPAPTPAIAERLLDRIQIRSERVGQTGYRATFTAAFAPLAVRGFLARHGARAVDTPAPQILLIPVHVDDGIPIWWEGAEAWAAALSGIAFEDGLTPARLPSNTRSDLASSTARILAADHATLASFRLRYRTQGVVAALAETVPGRDRVLLTLIGEDAAGPIDRHFEVASGGLPAAAARLAEVLSDRWKSAIAGTPQHLAPERPALAVRVVLHDGERQWSEIQRRLEESGQVLGVSVEHGGSASLNVLIWHVGEPDRLAVRLAAYGLDLFPAGGAWVLQSY